MTTDSRRGLVPPTVYSRGLKEVKDMTKRELALSRKWSAALMPHIYKLMGEVIRKAYSDLHQRHITSLLNYCERKGDVIY